MAACHPRELSRLELIRLAEYQPESAPPLLARTCVIGVKEVPCRWVACPCGYPWASHVLLDAPGNACPKCGRGASAKDAGPIVHDWFSVPIRIETSAIARSREV